MLRETQQASTAANTGPTMAKTREKSPKSHQDARRDSPERCDENRNADSGFHLFRSGAARTHTYSNAPRLTIHRKSTLTSKNCRSVEVGSPPDKRKQQRQGPELPSPRLQSPWREDHKPFPSARTGTSAKKHCPRWLTPGAYVRGKRWLDLCVRALAFPPCFSSGHSAAGRVSILERVKLKLRRLRSTAHAAPRC